MLGAGRRSGVVVVPGAHVERAPLEPHFGPRSNAPVLRVDAGAGGVLDIDVPESHPPVASPVRQHRHPTADDAPVLEHGVKVAPVEPERGRGDAHAVRAATVDDEVRHADTPAAVEHELERLARREPAPPLREPPNLNVLEHDVVAVAEVKPRECSHRDVAVVRAARGHELHVRQPEIVDPPDR